VRCAATSCDDAVWCVATAAKKLRWMTAVVYIGVSRRPTVHRFILPNGRHIL
jgi:hypothetical protein